MLIKEFNNTNTNVDKKLIILILMLIKKLIILMMNILKRILEICLIIN